MHRAWPPALATLLLAGALFGTAGWVPSAVDSGLSAVDDRLTGDGKKEAAERAAERARQAAERAERVKHEPYCTRRPGPYQREVEGYLGLPADGRQSRTDCRTIQAYQRDRGLAETAGLADAATHGQLALENIGPDPDPGGRCPRDEGRIVCVDLTRQLLWVSDGGRKVYGAVPVRSGRAGRETRTGLHTIWLRDRDEWSWMFGEPMPYAQYFDQGQALHGVMDRDIHRPIGSHGCVNLRLKDAEALWGLLRDGDPVFVYGERPAPR
ncbi:L,D-transpeptidase [Streptomyces sp. NPDC051940]|uniref:L,D-transpeptidase n=1 Tax=Streptomyces sp. NPDC051940 TaxID=3155675 RepID=UPI00342E4BCC